MRIGMYVSCVGLAVLVLLAFYNNSKRKRNVMSAEEA